MPRRHQQSHFFKVIKWGLVIGGLIAIIFLMTWRMPVRQRQVIQKIENINPQS